MWPFYLEVLLPCGLFTLRFFFPSGLFHDKSLDALVTNKLLCNVGRSVTFDRPYCQLNGEFVRIDEKDADIAFGEYLLEDLKYLLRFTKNSTIFVCK